MFDMCSFFFSLDDCLDDVEEVEAEYTGVVGGLLF